MFLELSDKDNISEYLEVLVTYLVNSPGKLTEEELQEPVTRIIEEGGADMQTIFEKWVEKGKWDMIMNLLREGIPIDIIAKTSGFTAAQINEFKEKMKDQQVNAAA